MMNRRKFIQNSSALTIPVLLNGMMVKALGGQHILSSILQHANVETDKVLVLVQLFGGNDGLNTLVPLDNYSKYVNARKNIAIAENKTLLLTGISTSGFHPALTGLRDLYNEGKLSILQSVGYPMPNFSHFRSSDIWLSGSNADETLHTGWMGRYLSKQYPDYPVNYPNNISPHPLAIQIGTATSFALQGNKAPMGINVADPNNIHNIANGFSDIVNESFGGKELSFIRQVAQQSQAYGQVLKQAAAKVTQQSAYPVGNSLASQLKTVAALIKSGLQTKVYLVSFDGFDTHAQQVNANDSSTGRHADLLKITGDAIKAFQDDLKFLSIEDRVTGMTFSEFGRRIVSNESLGTDHGTAAPLFVFGKKVKAGIIGANPTIPDNVTTEDNLEMKIDFRAVYASILKDWMNVSATDMNSVLYKEFQHIPIIQ
jgi:uncharacterized protein (DUF1501 family)